MDYVASRLNIKSVSETGTIEGLLAGFNNVDSHGDVIEPGAFTRTLSERGDTPLPMLLHHDMHRPIGVWTGWQERNDGLHVSGKLSLATRDAQEAQALAKDGALTGLSIGYRVRSEQRDRASGENRLIDLELLEGSHVTIPSNPVTRVSAVKSIGCAGDIAALLRGAGVSGRKAKSAAGLAWKSINNASDEAEAEAEIQSILSNSAARIAALRS